MILPMKTLQVLDSLYTKQFILETYLGATDSTCKYCLEKYDTMTAIIVANIHI